ncbi:MAG: helix-hairpin-helix domain-containing protein, partial [Oscillospiraceae bacterium]|nr:helix-hairpin-helix domain-containing protein [Oscillospiraceae bacterium]
ESELLILDINRASVSKFAKLSGVSRSLAEQIVNYRNTNGNFQTVSEIITAGMPEQLFYQLQDCFYIANTEKIPETTHKTIKELITESMTEPEFSTEFMTKSMTESLTEAIPAYHEIIITDISESTDPTEIIELTEPEIIFPLELNQATLEEFSALPYIGAVIAQEIIQYRESIGGFINRYQLLEVSGIGEFRFYQILPYVYLETEYPLPEMIPTDPTEQISETISEIPMINLNTATKEEFMLLPDCNEELAEEIIILRDKDIHIFYNILEITLAEHVTNALFAEWMPYLTIDNDGSTQIPYVPPFAQDES